ncbi:hypothetical protein [Maricaulis maris]|uniref:Uncharacterized protein n=1 Tax=Maricaulis maris TaxID=74318 RepID=A0A495DCM6_9PROT|nr:hypothetical protein [Maricaulis maris]RKR00049.1 hypothetical protein C7435_1247 [Maricaulis maris]
MSSIYELPLLDGPLDIVCPHCGGRAVFSTSHSKPLPVSLRTATGEILPDNWDGQVRCSACGHAAKHALDWPSDAWFKLDHRGETLWAKDAAMLAEIRRFIAAGAERQAIKKTSSHARYLVRIPAIFLKASDREALLRKIDRLC